tara:strand:- start:51 stop:341 length:291 start_codon:yes stop_codon:yes gene_type:complete
LRQSERLKSIRTVLAFLSSFERDFKAILSVHLGKGIFADVAHFDSLKAVTSEAGTVPAKLVPFLTIPSLSDSADISGGVRIALKLKRCHALRELSR